MLTQLTFSSSLPQSFSVVLGISALYLRISALRLPTVKWDAFVTSWRFYNRAWQPQRHDRLPETSGTLWIHWGALTNQRCSLATGCGIMWEIGQRWCKYVHFVPPQEQQTETPILGSNVYFNNLLPINVAKWPCLQSQWYVKRTIEIISIVCCKHTAPSRYRLPPLWNQGQF